MKNNCYTPTPLQQFNPTPEHHEVMARAVIMKENRLIENDLLTQP